MTWIQSSNVLSQRPHDCIWDLRPGFAVICSILWLHDYNLWIFARNRHLCPVPSKKIPDKEEWVCLTTAMFTYRLQCLLYNHCICLMIPQTKVIDWVQQYGDLLYDCDNLRLKLCTQLWSLNRGLPVMKTKSISN